MQQEISVENLNSVRELAQATFAVIDQVNKAKDDKQKQQALLNLSNQVKSLGTSFQKIQKQIETPEVLFSKAVDCQKDSILSITKSVVDTSIAEKMQGVRKDLNESLHTQLKPVLDSINKRSNALQESEKLITDTKSSLTAANNTINRINQEKQQAVTTATNAKTKADTVEALVKTLQSENADLKARLKKVEIQQQNLLDNPEKLEKIIAVFKTFSNAVSGLSN
jgi:methyl-accepting chemotaxis protein